MTVSPFRNLRPPFELPSDRLYFHDWRFVDHGAVAWRDADGEGFRNPEGDAKSGLWTTSLVPPLAYHPRRLPVGVRLRAEPATKSDGPVITPQMLGEGYVFGGTVLHEDGRYRMWMETPPVEGITDDDHPMGSFNYLHYAESDDGETWRFPAQNRFERGGSAANSAVYGPPLCGPTGFHGGSVFRDPSAQEAERYKMIFQGHVTAGQQARYESQGRPVDRMNLTRGTGRWTGLCGAVSPDGLSWTPLPEPLSLQISDTHNMCEWDEALGAYVAYVRNWLLSRRTIGRVQAESFGDWPLAADCLWPGPQERPSDLWYTSGKTRVPEAPEYHVMFPMRWSIVDDRFEFCLASSPDNVTWNLVPGGPVCVPGETGAWDGGVVAPGLGLVALPGQRVGIPLGVSEVPHKYPRKAPLGSVGWASWPQGRLVALDAEEEGQLWTWPLRTARRRLEVNARSHGGGSLRVQVEDGRGAALPGRTFDDCDPIAGDHLAHPVSWRGDASLGIEGDRTADVVLAFRLRRTRLYGVLFR